MEKLKGHLTYTQPVRESELHFRALVERAALVVWEADAVGNIVDSPNWFSVTGSDIDRPRKVSWLDAVHPDERSAVQEQWRHCLDESRIFRSEFRLRYRQGQWCWTQAHAVPVIDDNGSICKWVGMNFDISERKAAEDRLVKNERQLNLALDIGRMSFWSYDPRTGQVQLDPRMQVIWGEPLGSDSLPFEEVVARIHPEDRPLVLESIDAALDPRGIGVYLPNDYRIVMNDGTMRWVAANGMTMFDGRPGQRHPVELFGTVLDVTERKRIEDSVRESEERLQQLNIELEDRVRERTQELVDSEQRLRVAVEEAEQSNRQLRRLAVELSRTEERERRKLAQVLHNHLQQLLVAAKMRTESLCHETELPEAQERMIGIVTVLDMAIEATRSLAVELVPPVLHVQGLPTALRWLASHMKEQNGLSIEVDIDAGANPASEESRDLLFQAAREFLLNTIKHASVSTANLRLGLEGKTVILQVSDLGAGFDPNLADGEPHTFGLFHLRERLTAVGGELSIDSRINSGTCVTVRLAR